MPRAAGSVVPFDMLLRARVYRRQAVQIVNAVQAEEGSLNSLNVLNVWNMPERKACRRGKSIFLGDE